jgi:hypothetical protein
MSARQMLGGGSATPTSRVASTHLRAARTGIDDAKAPPDDWTMR